MKRILHTLFVAVLLVLSTPLWAQSETTTFKVYPSEGSYNKTGWCANWTSTTNEHPIASISVAGGINNMNASTTNDSGGFELAVGSNGNSNYTWNFSVLGYEIISYSFKFKSKENGKNVNVVAGGETIISSYSEEKTLTVNNVNAQIASFQLTGSNYAIIVTELTFTVSSPILEAGQVYTFNNVAYEQRSLAANGTSDVHTKTTDAADKKQQWYVIKEGNYYVLRNVETGKYLQGSGQSRAWIMSDDYSNDYNKFELYPSNTTYNTLHTKTLGDHAYMHDSNNPENGGYNIVGWSNGDDTRASHWVITKVEYSDEELEVLFDNFIPEETIESALSEIFSDKACTTLKDNYSSISDEELKADANYKALPSVLKKLVEKVRSGDWSEDNADSSKDGWGSKYAQKFRVQMYEPYSIANDITNWLGINYHANNDNPTGIYVPAAGKLYIMVEGAIDEGATLRLVDAGSNDRILNATTRGNTLQQGLNVVEFTEASGMLYICYNVDTYNPNGTDDATRFPYKLSDYAPLKIHIEGGAINGFYNACGDFRATADDGSDNLWKQITTASVDEDADWVYMETRANLSVLPVLGHRQILLFSLGETEGNNGMAYYLPENIEVPQTPYNSTKKWSDYGMGCDPSTGKINIMLEAWDRIMYSELATMGLVSKTDMAKMNEFYPRWNADGTVRSEIYDYSGTSAIDGKTLEEFCGVDYSEVFNHHGVALGVGGNSYMYGSGDHCGYNHNTMSGIIQTIASNAGSTWGPAHEIGHQHQGLLTLNGLTEVTNNLFSNIALWYKGLSTSRYNGADGSLENVLNAYNTENSDIYTNNIWALTHLYYRLWLYYHLAGNNTQFYPRLFELLRHDPMQKGYYVSGDVSTLHFYKLACEAAGEDLTEFFRAHGYFSIMDNRLVGDYSNSEYTVTEQMIEDAIAEVKAKDYKENLSIIFICDDIVSKTIDGTKYAAHYQHDGTTLREIYGETKPNSDLGAVSDFVAGTTSITAPYAAVYNNDGTLTMSGGEGGVGFLVLNEKGEIVSFSNKKTFALSDDAKEAIISGKATVVALDGDNNTSAVVVDLVGVKRDILASLIAEVKSMTDKIDDTYTKVGYFKGALLADLKIACENATEVYESGTGYEGAYELLYAEYQKVKNNSDAKIPFDPSRTYIITNYAYPTRNITVSENTAGEKCVYAYESATGNAAQWKFVESGTAGKYYLKNLDGYYCPAVSWGGSGGSAVTASSSAGMYALEELENGVWAIKGGNPMHASQSQNYSIVGWSTDAPASRWYLTYVESNTTMADLSALQSVMTKTEALVADVATINYAKGGAVDLQTTTEGGNYYLTCNAPEDNHEGDIANLVDGATNNYFHTEWSSEPESGSHYLVVNMGSGNGLQRFTFGYTTRSGAQSDFPKAIDVYGSNDGSNYKLIGSVDKLPQTAGTSYTYDGAMVAPAYQYLRFNVHANRGYWHMAEFDIYPVTSLTADVKEFYATNGITPELVKAAQEAYLNAVSLVESSSPATESIATVKAALDEAYKNLKDAYDAIIATRKEALAALVTETDALMATAGSVALDVLTPLQLTTNNLFCNDPHLASGSDYSAEYVSKLTDGDTGTYLHTDYSDSNPNGTTPHYLRVDLGENSPATGFKFTYTTRSNGNDCPTEIVVAGCATADGDYTPICTLKESDAVNPLPNGNALVYNSSALPRLSTYRYIRLTVTSTERSSSARFFVLSEFGFSTVAHNIEVDEKYSEFVSEELLLSTYFVKEASAIMANTTLGVTTKMLDAQIADLTAARDALQAEMNKVVPVDKSELESAYSALKALYDAMAAGDGSVNSNYSPSSLTREQLAAAQTALLAAKEQIDATTTTQDAVDAAKGALQTAIVPLRAVEDANVAETINKDALNTLISNAEGLLTTISEKVSGNSNYYAAVDESLGADELNEALNTAQNVATRYYLTEGQYNDALTALQNCYNTTNGVVAADATDRQELTDLIATMKGLLDETTGGAVQTIASLPLQASDKNAPYYIWSNAKSYDSSDVDALLDQNEDGSANTGTFFGTEWRNNPPTEDYIHYLEIDLGANVIENLAIDYTTRDSEHANQRPTGLKFFGSNDKNVYTEIHAITEDLATGRCEQWTMPAPIELEKNYRYIRVAVATDAHYFNMSDFNIYASSVATVNEFYSTSNIFDCLPAGLREYFDAKETVGAYVTEDDYNTAKSELQAQIDALQGVIDSNFESRTPLETLVDDTEALIAEVATVDATEQRIALQCTDENAPYYIYCNAPGNTNSWESDRGGVAAVIDLVGDEPNVETFLHTTYSGNDKADDAETLGHYLRVDWGEKSSVVAFKFSYKSRSGYDNDAPKVVIIEGGNALNDFEVITTVTAENPAAYQSDEITNGKAYRYIRFRVKETTNNKSNPFFSMSHFAMTACMQVAVKEAYTPQLPASVVAATYKEKVEGDFVATHYAVESTYTATLEALQDAYDNLAAQMLDRNGLNDLIAWTRELCGSVNASENPTLYIYNTAELLAETLAAITPASELLEQKVVTKAQYDAVLATLQAAYDKLLFAINHKNVPVKLTTDVNNPVLYTIYSQRGDSDIEQTKAKCWQYNIAASNITIVEHSNDNLKFYHLWYFVPGDSDNDVKIVPVLTPGYLLAANDFGGGANKVFAKDDAASEGDVKTWQIEAQTNNNLPYYNFKPTGQNTYLSNFGGGNNPLGFYGSADAGSRVYFERVEVENYAAARLNALCNIYGGELPVVENALIGCYTAESAQSYNDARDAAISLLGSDAATAESLVAEFNNLWAVTTSLQRNMPVEGGFYKIRSAFKNDNGTDGYSYNALVYADDVNGMLWQKGYEETSSRAIWCFTPVDGGYNIWNLHTGDYVPSLGGGSQGVLAGTNTPVKYTIEVLDEATGILNIKSPDQPMHAQATGNKLVGWGGGVNSASAWVIEPVDEKTSVQQAFTLNTAAGEEKSYSTLYSAYPVTLPAGVNAHIITACGEGNTLVMEPVTTDDGNRVVPARTAVILSADKDDATSTASVGGNLCYSDAPAAVTIAQDENMLHGTLLAEYVYCAQDEWLYSLGRKNNHVAMYKAYKNYQKNETTGEYAKIASNSNDGNYVKMGANKAYLLLGGGSQGTISTYSFQFGGGTTGIDDVDNENPLEGTIYDLHGRKLSEINTPGYYIINGKKTYVSEVK